jgi:Ca-activated chloride channel family protein
MMFRTVLILITIFVGFEVALASEKLSTIRNNNAGVDQLLQEDGADRAFDEFVKALEEGSQQPIVHLNLGLTYEQRQQPENALKEYKTALALVGNDEKLKFQALFNAANVYAKLKNIPQALSHFQQALEINPDSIEVKTNIELLWQQGGGGGDGDSQQKKQPQDGENKNDQSQGDDKDQQKPPQQGEQKSKPSEGQKKKRKPFKSKVLTKDDVRRILEEIKNQEQKIRAKEFDKAPKEMPKGKDW